MRLYKVRSRKVRPAIQCEDYWVDSGPHDGCSEWSPAVDVRCMAAATHVVKTNVRTEDDPYHAPSRNIMDRPMVRLLMCKYHADKANGQYFDTDDRTPPARSYRFRRIRGLSLTQVGTRG